MVYRGKRIAKIMLKGIINKRILENVLSEFSTIGPKEKLTKIDLLKQG